MINNFAIWEELRKARSVHMARLMDATQEEQLCKLTDGGEDADLVAFGIV